MNNTLHVYVLRPFLGVEVPSSKNIWNDEYPSGGNYWSDYLGKDERKGLNQGQLGDDGIGDTPYFIDTGNVDYYPI